MLVYYCEVYLCLLFINLLVIESKSNYLEQNQNQRLQCRGQVMWCYWTPLHTFVSFKKLTALLMDGKTFVNFERLYFSKFVLLICSFEKGRSHLRQMFNAIWSLILKRRAYQQVFSCMQAFCGSSSFLIPFLLKSSRGWLEKERGECVDMCTRCYPVVWLV